MIKNRFFKVSIKHNCQFFLKHFKNNNNDDLKVNDYLMI